MDQETRRNDINALYQDLTSKKSVIDQKWSGLEGAADLELRVYSQDKDCLRSEKLLSEIDLYPGIASNGSGRQGIEYKIGGSSNKKEKKKHMHVPECTKYATVDFSLSLFEHLPAMRNRANMTSEPQKNLERFMPMASVEQFGHEITAGLSKNGSSWLHYNLASLYWRIKGDAPKAIECIRRAIYFSPRYVL